MKCERSTCRVRKPCLLGRLLALLPISCALLYPLYLAGQLDLTEETYASQTLPEAFSGLRLVYLSDIHYGKYLSAQRVAELAARINELRPDIVILGGDYGEDTTAGNRFFEGGLYNRKQWQFIFSEDFGLKCFRKDKGRNREW